MFQEYHNKTHKGPLKKLTESPKDIFCYYLMLDHNHTSGSGFSPSTGLESGFLLQPVLCLATCYRVAESDNVPHSVGTIVPLSFGL